MDLSVFVRRGGGASASLALEGVDFSLDSFGDCLLNESVDFLAVFQGFVVVAVATLAPAASLVAATVSAVRFQFLGLGL